MTSHDPPPTSPLDGPGAVLALAGAAAQVLAAFLPWDRDGRVALDLSLVSSEPTLASFGTAMLVLAALPALATLAWRRGWPRLVSAVLTATLVLWWVSLGPAGTLVAGVWAATGAVVAHLLAAALSD